MRVKTLAGLVGSVRFPEMGRKAGVIALFDVDGTLTPARKVKNFLSMRPCVKIRFVGIGRRRVNVLSDFTGSDLACLSGGGFYFFQFFKILLLFGLLCVYHLRPFATCPWFCRYEM